MSSHKRNMILILLGKADCPHFSRMELLADYLASCNQDFKVHKIVKTPQEWPVSNMEQLTHFATELY